MKTLNNNHSLSKQLIRTLAVTSLIFSACCQLSFAEDQPLDRVVAVVDDDVVLASEVTEKVQQLLQRLNKAGRPAPSEETLRKEIMDQLILENIQLQMANRAGVRINDAQLNEAVSRIARQNNMDLTQFKAALEADGLSYNATREQIRRDMTIDRVQQGNVNQRIQVTDQEIANFLDSDEGKALTSPEYRMLHTLVPISSSASDDDIAKAQARANALYQRISHGESYAAVMAAAKLTTNDLGWRKKDDLPSLLTDLTSTLQNGQTAAPIQSASGFHLVKLEDSRGRGETIPQTHARHILLKPSAIRDDEASKQQLAELRQRILNGANFADIAREYSEDIGSAQEGGDLGWTNPGQLVETFQNAMDETAINAISPAFRSPYGWHIVQVLERRQKDVTDDIRKNIARNYIYKRKFDDELQSWLQQIRDEAYVDIK